MPFAEGIKNGQMIENCINLGKNVSHAAIRATTQEIPSGSGNFGKSEKEGRIHDGILV